MARSVPKCKRAAHVYDRDFIVVDDISGVLKMRSECAIDGYGFLSSQGDMRNPQEIPPIINEQMAAWPDPRPIGQPVFTPSPDYQYFLFNYFVSDVADDSSTFDATASVGLNAPIASMAWYVDGVYAVSGLVPVVPMSFGLHDISVLITDDYGNQQTFDFTYTQPGVVRLLMHFDGANGSTTFTDSSSFNWTATGYATAQLSTSIKKFGTASFYMPVNHDYLQVQYQAGNFGTQDFCVEGWVYPVTKALFGGIFQWNANFVGFCLQWSSDAIKILVGNAAGNAWAHNVTGTTTVALNTWTHLAVTRQGQILRFFINGVLEITINAATTYFPDTVNNFNIGGFGNHFGVGYIDEVRIVRGSAVYTSNFTPPTAPFS